MDPSGIRHARRKNGGAQATMALKSDICRQEFLRHPRANPDIPDVAAQGSPRGDPGTGSR